MLTRAQDLLRRVIAGGELRLDEIAAELIVTPRELGEYLSGARVIPLTRQLCLALLVIERVSALSRRGYALRAQARAAIAVEHARMRDAVGDPSIAPGAHA